jgi:acetyl-CoA carboxylase biotin carboxyl carrier protein
MNNRKDKPLRNRIAKAITGESMPDIDADVVRELAKLLEETGLSELEIEQGGVRVRVARGATVFATAGAMPAAAPAAAAGSTAAEARPEPAQRPGTVVTSPMVGTVYLAPQPGAVPFVKIGDAVTDGTLCIIEAMKTMNPVPSPVAGRVVEIFVRDGQPVEFGEPLMRIE